MLTRTLLGCLTLLTAMALHAEPLTATQIADILTPQDSLSGQFQQQRFLAVLPMPLISSGHFSYQRERGLEWVIEQPIASTVTISQQGIEQTQGGEVVWQSGADSPETSTVANLMAAIFAADLDALQQTFAVTGESTDSDDLNSGWQLTLTPKSEVLGSFFKDVEIHGSQNLMKQLIMRESDGNRSEIRFTHLTAADLTAADLTTPDFTAEGTATDAAAQH